MTKSRPDRTCYETKKKDTPRGVRGERKKKNMKKKKKKKKKRKRKKEQIMGRGREGKS